MFQNRLIVEGKGGLRGIAEITAARVFPERGSRASRVQSHWGRCGGGPEGDGLGGAARLWPPLRPRANIEYRTALASASALALVYIYIYREREREIKRERER